MRHALAIREVGGHILAQDPQGATASGMPGSVANAGLAHQILPLGDLAEEIRSLLAGPSITTGGAPR